MATAKSKTKEAELAKEIAQMEENTYQIVGGQVHNTKIKVFTPDEYKEFSAQNGLIMGRHPDQKTPCSIEELRALINSNWTPKMVMEKHGMTPEDLKQLVWKLSKAELRDKPIKYSIEGNFFSREG
jgi:uracil DNA glycosylase